MANEEYRDYEEKSQKAIASITQGKPSTYGATVGVLRILGNLARFLMKSATFKTF